MSQSQQLYAARTRIHPRAVTGRFRNLKWLILFGTLAVYHLVPWIRWDRGPNAPDQAILLDLAGRRGYIFDFEIWPQEVYYLTGFLILAAVGLFFMTSLFGRVWCGFACPQTVWTDLFMWVERQIEGDRVARQRLDKQGLNWDKLTKRVVKHLIWLLIGFLMSFAWIWYFNDAPRVTVAIFRGEAGGWVYAFIAMLTLTTYLLAGLAREQVCFYMCPWPRFQGAMFDEHTLIVTYEEDRGEPRGKAPKDRDFSNRGDCVDCTLCVQVCPTGIDIRHGQQMQCIGCALCIDACNSIMAKLDLPPNLITYDSQANQVARSKGDSTRVRLLRPRTLIYAGFLTLVAGVMVTTMAMRSRLEINVIRDRAPLFVTLSSGDIRNAYTYKILNMENQANIYKLSVDGLAGAGLTVSGSDAQPADSLILDARPDTVESYRVFVTAGKDALDGPSTPVTFVLVNTVTGQRAENATVFAGPEGR